MIYFDEKLKLLQEQMARKEKLEAMITELDRERLNVAKKVWELEKAKNTEEADVEKLEKTSLSTLILKLFDKIDDKLAKERREAYAARMKYDTAAKELHELESRIFKLKTEFRELKNSDAEYEKVLNEKSEAIKQQGGELAEKIFKLEEAYYAMENHKKELDEAIIAGNKALSIANDITFSLEKAENWGKWDVMGGRTMTDVVKHSHLDQAQVDVTRLQYELRAFHAELADVKIYDNMQVSMEGFTRFADYFFDGIFADWTILNRIGQSKEQVNNTKMQIRTALNRLNSMHSSAVQQQSRLKSERDELVKNTKA